MFGGEIKARKKPMASSIVKRHFKHSIDERNLAFGFLLLGHDTHFQTAIDAHSTDNNGALRTEMKD